MADLSQFKEASAGDKGGVRIAKSVAAGRDKLRLMLRGFFGPMAQRGVHAVDVGAGFESRQVMSDKVFISKLKLPAKLIFLFRLRFGLYAVLAQLGHPDMRTPIAQALAFPERIDTGGSVLPWLRSAARAARGLSASIRPVLARPALLSASYL